MIMKLWIVRDLDGTLSLSDGEEPKSILGVWIFNKNHYNIDNRLFPEITFVNSPQEIELKLVK